MLKKVSHLPRQYPNISFFLMSQVLDPHLLMEAMHLGVKEFIPLPMSEDKLTAAVERAARLWMPNERPRHSSDPQHRRVRFHHGGMQHCGVFGQTGQDLPGGHGPGSRRRGQLLRRQAAIHHCRRHGVGRQGG